MNNTKRNKIKIRSALSGKIINGREVILTTEAIDYINKMGYSNKLSNKLNKENFVEELDKIIISFIRGDKKGE